MLDAFAGEIATTLVVTGVLTALRAVGVDVIGRASLVVRTVVLSVSRRDPWVLVYTDCDDHGLVTKTVTQALNSLAKDRKSSVRFLSLDHTDRLFEWPIFGSRCAGILLLSTNVTTLGSRPQRRKELQDRLVKFVERGGTLVLGHDLLWRRSRNEVLQQVAGVALSTYVTTTDPVEYVRRDIALSDQRGPMPAVQGAPTPEKMLLRDGGEILKGTVQPDVEVLYVWGDDPSVPLITRRRQAAGNVFWLNSGDSGPDGPPHSIAAPDPALGAMIVDFIAAATGHRKAS